jgi:hypothetical protein
MPCVYAEVNLSKARAANMQRNELHTHTILTRCALNPDPSGPKETSKCQNARRSDWQLLQAPSQKWRDVSYANCMCMIPCQHLFRGIGWVVSAFYSNLNTSGVRKIEHFNIYLFIRRRLFNDTCEEAAICTRYFYFSRASRVICRLLNIFWSCGAHFIKTMCVQNACTRGQCLRPPRV